MYGQQQKEHEMFTVFPPLASSSHEYDHNTSICMSYRAIQLVVEIVISQSILLELVANHGLVAARCTSKQWLKQLGQHRILYSPTNFYIYSTSSFPLPLSLSLYPSPSLPLLLPPSPSPSLPLLLPLSLSLSLSLFLSFSLSLSLSLLVTAEKALRRGENPLGTKLGVAKRNEREGIDTYIRTKNLERRSLEE